MCFLTRYFSTYVFIEKIIKSFLAILKAIYPQLLDDLQQHLKKAMLKFKWGLKLIYLN